MRWPALSLFWKIYLTLVGGVVLVALVVFGAGRLIVGAEEAPWRQRGARFFEASIPRDDPGPAVERLKASLGARMAVYDAEGRLVAGEPVRGRRPFTLELSDGRRVQMRFNPAQRQPEREPPNPILPLLLVLATIPAAAYPVVRNLTRRLDRLRAGAEAWGAGDLSARIAMTGRDEVASVARSFDRAAATVEQLVAAHAGLLANASHELRSPLARLRMAVDLYEAGPTPALKAEIVASLGELDGLVEEILIASRLERIGAIGPLEPVDLAALAAEEGARVGATVSGSAPPVMADGRLLRRLVRNLMQNAERHGASPIAAHVSATAGGVRLTVDDAGPGIAVVERERVFEPFYRPAGRSEAVGGWGLGLALVRMIARRHGGEAGCDTAPGGGARFLVDLPQDAAPASGTA